MSAHGAQKQEVMLELLDRWHQLQQEGQPISVTELCRDHPHLAGEMERVLQLKHQLESVAYEDPQKTVTHEGSSKGYQEPASPEHNAFPDLGSRYHIETRLGEGSMGKVYRAHDRRLGRTVAIKVIRTDNLSMERRSRLEAEARAVAQLDHPHIVRIFDVGEFQVAGEVAPVPYLSMEYVEGGNLGNRLRSGIEMSLSGAVRLVALLARAVQHAHHRGIVHRDIKPENVMLASHVDVAALNTELGCPKIADFGLARQVQVEHRQTQSGSILGTPAYMAPEQAQGQSDVRSPADVYALGVLLYQLLTGQLPFEASTTIELLYKVCKEQPQPPRQRNPEVPEELQAPCMDCLHKQPEQRPTAEQLAQRLETWEANQQATTSTLLSSSVPTSEGSHARPGLRWSAGWRMAVLLGLSLGLLLGTVFLVRVFRQENPPQQETQQGRQGTTAMPTKPLKILRLDVLHYARNGKFEDLVGRLGVAEGSFSTQLDDSVTVVGKLSEPAYSYLIAYLTDGKEDLCFPENPDDPPPLTDEPKFPLRAGGLHYGLEEGEGLMVFVLVASRKPLPAYRKWRRTQGSSPWRHTRAMPGVVWRGNDRGLLPATVKDPEARGKREDATGRKPLTQLLKWLRQDEPFDAVQAVAFPVTPKP